MRGMIENVTLSIQTPPPQTSANPTREFDRGSFRRMLRETMDRTASPRGNAKRTLSKNPPPEDAPPTDTAAQTQAVAATIVQPPVEQQPTAESADAISPADTKVDAVAQSLAAPPLPPIADTAQTIPLMLPVAPTDLPPELAQQYSVGMTKEEYAAYIAAQNSDTQAAETAPTPPITRQTATVQTAETQPDSPVDTTAPIVTREAETATTPPETLADNTAESTVPEQASPETPPQITPATAESNVGNVIVGEKPAIMATGETVEPKPAETARPAETAKPAEIVQLADTAKPADTAPATPATPPPISPETAESDAENVADNVAVQEKPAITAAGETVEPQDIDTAKPIDTAQATPATPPITPETAESNDGKVTMQAKPAITATGETVVQQPTETAKPADTAPASTATPPPESPAIPESDGKVTLQAPATTTPTVETTGQQTTDTAQPADIAQPTEPAPASTVANPPETPVIPENGGKTIVQVQSAATTPAETAEQQTANLAKPADTATQTEQPAPTPEKAENPLGDRVSQAMQQLAALRATKGQTVTTGTSQTAAAAKTAAKTTAATETITTPVTETKATEATTRTEQNPDHGAESQVAKEEKPTTATTAEMNATPPRTTFNDLIGRILGKQEVAETSPAKQIEAEILTNLENQKMEFRMQLQPADLGKIDVRMVLESGKLIVEIVSTAKTNEMLARQADSLAATLRLDNPELSSVQVVTQTAQSGTAYLENALQGGDTSPGRQNSEGRQTAPQTPQHQSETEERIGADTLIRLGILSRTLDYSI